ncbi:hypothetical protein GCM10007989_01990 [Devosia pacifica]|uniref:Uncharacterized protein n=1 Tax=Devosia pacifica TaxID=1335967 RepID=A0A918VLM3_9HYPH|nr:hypothetical protein GCM10007989_01990 [Devosia pacifica]
MAMKDGSDVSELLKLGYGTAGIRLADPNDIAKGFLADPCVAMLVLVSVDQIPVYRYGASGQVSIPRNRQYKL